MLRPAAVPLFGEHLAAAARASSVAQGAAAAARAAAEDAAAHIQARRFLNDMGWIAQSSAEEACSAARAAVRSSEAAVRAMQKELEASESMRGSVDTALHDIDLALQHATARGHGDATVTAIHRHEQLAAAIKVAEQRAIEQRAQQHDVLVITLPMSGTDFASIESAFDGLERFADDVRSCLAELLAVVSP